MPTDVLQNVLEFGWGDDLPRPKCPRLGSNRLCNPLIDRLGIHETWSGPQSFSGSTSYRTQQVQLWSPPLFAPMSAKDCTWTAWLYIVLGILLRKGIHGFQDSFFDSWMDWSCFLDHNLSLVLLFYFFFLRSSFFSSTWDFGKWFLCSSLHESFTDTTGSISFSW